MFVIGTAGHIDHGKSTLIEALTGIDPDRLREEKARGMTIELGFAWLEFDSGLEVSVVDVPGHERFIKNMLMGAGGIELALIVISADEGVMPQTREHVAILDLLDVRRAVVALTKSDLVDPEWIELVKQDITDFLVGTCFELAPIIAVSSTDGSGIAELTDVLQTSLAGLQEKQDLGRPRLPIDRIFTMRGFGTVVTGTLTDGRLSVGQNVEILPNGSRARIRGLQTHKKSQDEASPGTRVAVNLSNVSYDEITRGDLLVLPGWLQPSKAIDVSLRVLDDSHRPVKHNSIVTFYSGTKETLARVRLLDKAEIAPGEFGWAQIKVDEPVAVVKGDYFVIRDTVMTLGGGKIADLQAPRQRRFHIPTIERLRALSEGTSASVLVEALHRSEPMDIVNLSRAVNLSEEETLTKVKDLVEGNQAVELQSNNGDIYYTDSGWLELSTKTVNTVNSYHQKYPLRIGMPREELRNRLGLNQVIFLSVMERLAGESVVESIEVVVRLPNYQIVLSDLQHRMMEEYLNQLGSSPYSPPTGGNIDVELLNMLVHQQKVVRTSDGVVFLKSAYDEIEAHVINCAQENGKVTIGDVREILGTSRKYTLAILEYMDTKQLTMRIGDDRVLR